MIGFSPQELEQRYAVECRGWTRDALGPDDPAPWRDIDGNYHASPPAYMSCLQEASAILVHLRAEASNPMGTNGEFEQLKKRFSATFSQALFITAITFALQIRDPQPDYPVIAFAPTSE